MKISLVIGTYNQYKKLTNLFDSIRKQKEYVHEVIFCDDGSSDDTWAFVRQLSQHAEVPVQGFSQTRQGMRLARNINNGLRHATGDLIFIVMGDSYLQEDTLKNLTESYIPGTAGCGVRVNVDGYGKFLSLDWRIKEDTTAIMQGVNYSQMTGNSMIVTTEDLKRIGYWDEEYVGYGRDDYSVFWRLQKAGVPLAIYGNVRINHIYHGEGQPDNPKNVERFERELKGEL